MTPATAPRAHKADERLLVIDPSQWREGGDAPAEGAAVQHAQVRDLPRFLRRGDLLVVNDAATVPGSLAGVGPANAPIEVRLAQPLPVSADAGQPTSDGERWLAVLFGAGDWRTPTERRPAPPALVRGDSIAFGTALSAEVEQVWPLSPRLVTIRFDRRGAALWSAIYRYGRPIQYSYLRAPLDLWTVQTAYASRPWAVELPSAGRPLEWELLGSLRRQGVGLAALTHAAGISSTGDPAIDAALPLPERYEIPAATAFAIARAKEAGGRVVAVGTSVVRALEGAAAPAGGALQAGAGQTDLLIGPGYCPKVANGLFTGLHEPTASHFALLQAFAPAALLRSAYAQAEERGYLGHELGDSSLILAAP